MGSSGMFALSLRLIWLLFIKETAAVSSTTPLIKNVYQGGQHFEGPHWSVAENALYWVDITGQNVHRLDSETNNVTTRNIAYGPVSLVTTIKDNPKLVLVAVRCELYLMPWDSMEDDTSLRLLSVVDLGMPDNRVNDGKVDAKGRLWFGTMGKEEGNFQDKDRGTLYMMDQYNHLNPADKVRPVSVSNGIAWTADNKSMFYIDSPTGNIDVFDFDIEKGDILRSKLDFLKILGNRRTLFSFQANNLTGVPDGMTIDSDGNLWVACFNGWKVIKIDSKSGKLLKQLKMPVSKVSSVMFGGPELSTLFVTTSAEGLSEAELINQPEAGSLYAIEGTGSKGMPQNQFVYPNASNY